MLKSKRGISPILATLLLIVIAVAAIVVTYAWVITFTTNTQQQAAILGKTNVYYNGTHIVIDVKNTGTSDAKIQAVYIGLSAGALVEQSASYDPSTKMVTAYGGMIKITVAYPNTVGTRYYFKIVPELGQPTEFNEVRS
jgi:flagellin-like protein